MHRKTINQQKAIILRFKCCPFQRVGFRWIFCSFCCYCCCFRFAFSSNFSGSLPFPALHFMLNLRSKPIICREIMSKLMSIRIKLFLVWPFIWFFSVNVKRIGCSKWHFCKWLCVPLTQASRSQNQTFEFSLLLSLLLLLIGSFIFLIQKCFLFVLFQSIKGAPYYVGSAQTLPRGMYSDRNKNIIGKFPAIKNLSILTFIRWFRYTTKSSKRFR